MGKHKKKNRRGKANHQTESTKSESPSTTLSQPQVSPLQIDSQASSVSTQLLPAVSPDEQNVLSVPSLPYITTEQASDNSQDNQSDNKSMNNISQAESLKIPCLGRYAELGTLYNCHSDKFFADEVMWDKDAIQAKSKCQKCENDCFEIITDDSFAKKAVSLGMDESTKLSFLGGLISVEGSAKYLENNKSSIKQARVVLKYNCNTFVQKLSMDQIQLEKMQSQTVIGKVPYTHVVTGVQYGMDVFFVFDRELSMKEDRHIVESFLVDSISKILKSHCEGYGPVMVSKDEEKEMNKFKCCYHSDIDLLKNPTTVHDSISVFKSLPKLLLKSFNDTGVYGIPKTAFLHHLNEFGFDLPLPIQDMNSDLLNEIQALMEHFNKIQLTASDLIKDEICCRFPGIKQQIVKFKERLFDFIKQVQQTLAEILPKVREGKAEKALLSNYIGNLKKTPFDIEKLELWLEFKKEEAVIITQSLINLENCAFVIHEKELGQFIHDSNIKYVLSLSFGGISSDSHPYLEEMADYLNNLADLSDSDESFKEHWFLSDSLHKVFLGQLNLFSKFSSTNKKNEELKCVVVASTGRKTALQSPGEIFLYVDGSRKSFQPPSAPSAIELITNAEYELEIKWDAPQNGSKDIQQYCIAYVCENAVSTPKCCCIITDSNKTHYRITQLLPKTSYVFKVAAICEAGRSVFSSPSRPLATKHLPSLAERSLEYCRLLSPSLEDVPAWYLLPLKETFHDDVMRLRKYEVRPGNRNSDSVTTKVLLIVGATGSGKTTLINGMINYLFGTQMDDNYRLKLIDEALQESQARSQTQYITAYTIQWQKGSRICHNLTIIDTPGYGDTRGITQDDHVTSQIKAFFEMEGNDAIDHLDAVGFVAQASAVRLTHTQKYVFDAILSIFGRDIADNIFMMLTFADGRAPPALDAIKAHKLPYKAYFKFNNSVFTQSSSKRCHESDDPDQVGACENETFDALFWKLAEESFSNFFSKFRFVEAKSLKLTKEVLKEREVLECTIEGFQLRIASGINHLTRMRQELLIIAQFEAEKSANKEFTRTLLVPKTRRIHFDEPGRCVTNCLNCNVTCHLKCKIRDDDKKYGCSAMKHPRGPNTTCRVCNGHCEWRKHVNRDHYFEEYIEEETVTMEDLKKKYDYADRSLSEKDNLLMGMYEQYNVVQIAVLEDMEIVRKSLQRLDEIAMKRNPMTTVEYIDVLIHSTKSEGKCGWEERLHQLQKARERAVMIQKMEKEGKQYNPFQEFQEEIKRVAKMKSSNKRSVTKTVKAFFGFN